MGQDQYHYESLIGNLESVYNSYKTLTNTINKKTKLSNMLEIVPEAHNILF